MARRSKRNLRLVAGIVLLTLGLLALAYGGFSYTEDRHEVDIGVAEFSFAEREHVSIPPWAGVASAVVGLVLIVTSRR